MSGKVILKKGDKVKLLPADQLLAVFRSRNFFTSDEARQRVAKEIGGREGEVDSIEIKYQFDYFFFKAGQLNYSIPYESVKF
jgi:hypothetical protein